MVRLLFLIAGSLSLLIESLAVGADSPGPQVLVYSSLEGKRAASVLEVFSKASGVRSRIVKVFRSADEALHRLYADRNNPVVDIWLGGNVESHGVAGHRGLLQVYRSRAATRNEFKDPEGYWTPIFLDPLAFGINLPKQQELRLSAPASWQDLIGPDLKNQITLPDQSRTTKLMIATLVFLLGEERATHYLMQLDQNIGSLRTDTFNWFGRHGSAKTVVAIDLTSTLLERADNGLIRTVLPKEGAAFETGAISILKGAPRLAAARRLVDWICGIEGQNALETTVAPLLPWVAATTSINSSERAPRPILIAPSMLPNPKTADRLIRTVTSGNGPWQ